MNLRTVIGILSGFIVIACLFWIALTSDAGTRESILVSIILTIASAVVTWLVSSHFASESSKKENTKLIDRIGEQSSEKILNQSKQLYSIEQYLDNKQTDLIENESHSNAVIFLESTRNMLRLIRSSNNTYLSDWAGVVSEEIREKLTKQSEAQSQLFEDLDLINYSSSPEQRERLAEKIEENSQKLPSHLVPKSNLKENHARIIEHIVLEDTNEKKSGRVKILLSEDSFKGHVVGKFKTEFSSPPHSSSSKLQNSPNSKEAKINLFAKTGTVYDFHVGIKSTEFNVPLKQGIYEVEYSFEK